MANFGGLLGKALGGLSGRQKQIDKAVNQASSANTRKMHHPNNGLDSGQDFSKVDKKFQDARRGLEDTSTPWGMAEAMATAKRGKKK